MKPYQRIFDKPNDEDIDKSDNIEPANPELKMNQQNNQLETVVLSGIQFKGDINGSHDLFLNGEISGTVELQARLFVGQTGRIKGEVKAESIIIEGEVEGTFSAKESIEIRDGGKCMGDLFSPSVKISDKAFFEGRVTMKSMEHNTPPEKAVEPVKEKPRSKYESDEPKEEISKIKVVDATPTVSSKKSFTESTKAITSIEPLIKE
jgi:cytoskeletal protein CcmA (bactofilin family)